MLAHHSPDPRARRLDISTTPPLRTPRQSPHSPWAPRLLTAFTIGLICVALFIASHHRSSSPLPLAWLPPSSLPRSLSLPLAPHLVLPSADAVSRNPALAFLPHPALKPTPEFLATLPSRCGHWMSSYIAFHNSVASGAFFLDGINRTGEVPIPPISVYRVDPAKRLGGISDRWPPLSTAALVSVLIGRALFIDWPGYEAAYTHVHLPWLVNTTWRDVYWQWTWYKENVAAVKAALSSGLPPPSPPPLLNQSALVVPEADVCDTGTHDNGLTFRQSSPAVVIEDLKSSAELREHYRPHVPVVWMTQEFWSKGLITKFYVSELRWELWTMGMREATTHGCMINLFMALNAEVQALFAPYALRLRSPGQMTVGMQIRMGDVAMTGKGQLSEQNVKDVSWQEDDQMLARYITAWTRCAQQLIDLHAIPDPSHSSHPLPTLLFLVADSVRVRSLLQAELGEKLLVVQPGGVMKVGHTDVGDPLLFNGSRTALAKESAGDYLRMAAGEQWLLAYCDYLVIEHLGSGFGRSASFRSVKVGHTFNARSGRRCDAEGDEGGPLMVKDFDSFGHRY